MKELQVNVAQLLQESFGATRQVALDAPVPDDEGIGVGTVHGELKLTRTDRGVLATGALKIAISDACSRCLKPIDYWVDVRVDDEFLPVVDIETGRRLKYEVEADADTKSIDDYHELDLTDTMIEYRAAALPLAPLCKDDCKGICSQCGVDLNESSHSCEAEIDPRWEKLRELLR
jgi:uncharacterized protein